MNMIPSYVNPQATFKYREDLSDGNKIILFEVYSSETCFDASAILRKVGFSVPEYVSVSWKGDDGELKDVLEKELRFSGRLTFEKIHSVALMIKSNFRMTFSYCRTTMKLSKRKWNKSRGELQDLYIHGICLDFEASASKVQ